MYLNEAFDREVDARERPERPIPAGEVDAKTVFSLGFAMLGLGVLALWLTARHVVGIDGGLALWAGLGTAAVIVAYNCE